MQATCPHCARVFDTSGAGPTSCPSCGRQVEVPALSAYLPAPDRGPGAASPGAQREDTPWERRPHVSFFHGFGQTWSSVMFRPQLFWPTVRPDAKLWPQALTFAWIIAILERTLSTALEPVSFGARRRLIELAQDFLRTLPNADPSLQTQLEEALKAPTAAGLLGGLIGYIVFFPLVLFAGAALVHLMCLLFGCAKNGFWASFRANAYASAPLLLAWIPCVNIIAFGYFALQLVFAVQSLQETTLGKATAVVLTPALALCCCCIPMLSMVQTGAAVMQRMLGS